MPRPGLVLLGATVAEAQAWLVGNHANYHLPYSKSIDSSDASHLGDYVQCGHR